MVEDALVSLASALCYKFSLFSTSEIIGSIRSTKFEGYSPELKISIKHSGDNSNIHLHD